MTDGRTRLLLAGAVIALALPYLVLGPNLLLDDWFTLWFRLDDGILWAGGKEQLRARPGAWSVFLVQFGLIGAHPLALYVLQVGVNAVAVLLLHAACRRLLGPPTALAVALVWAGLANHSTLDRWASAMPALVSLVLLLAGVVLLERTADGEGPAWTAGLAFVASGLTYEASLAPAAVAVIAIPWLCTRRLLPVRHVVALEAAVVATGAWMFANSQHRGGEFEGWLDFGAMLPAHVGWALVRPQWLGVALAVVGIVGVTLALARPLAPTLRSLPPRPTHLTLGGLAVIALGTAAFVRYPIAPTGLGDRANCVSSVGTALLWVGVGSLLWPARPKLARGAAAVFATLLVVGHVQRDVDYARAGDDSVRVLAALDRTYPSRPAGATVVVGPGPIRHHGIVGLIGPLDQAVRADSGDKTRRARVAEDAADWAATPRHLRLDVRPLLNR